MAQKPLGGSGPEIVGDLLNIKLPKLPGRGKAIVVLLVVLFAAFVGFYSTFLEYVAPDEYGIKEIKIGVHRGIQEQVYEPGLYFVMPFGFQHMHHFPRSVQVLELTAFETKKESLTRYFTNAAKIQTSDGFYVDVDVSILYRIADPYALITRVGPGRLYLDNGILPKAEPILKQAFGELTTEDFYNSPMRVEKARMARDLLGAELKPKGIQIDHILVRYFKYSDEIQRSIEEKKLQDQLVFKNQAEAKAAIEEAKLKQVTQEGEMKVIITLQEGDAYKVKKDAERELYTRKKEAEADLLVQLAEAERTELKNQAMLAGSSDRLVAMSMAEVLEGLDTILVPAAGPDGVNPLDLDALLGLFGVDTAGVAPPSPAAAAAQAPAIPPVPAVAVAAPTPEVQP